MRIVSRVESSLSIGFTCTVQSIHWCRVKEQEKEKEAKCESLGENLLLVCLPLVYMTKVTLKEQTLPPPPPPPANASQDLFFFFFSSPFQDARLQGKEAEKERKESTLSATTSSLLFTGGRETTKYICSRSQRQVATNIHCSKFDGRRKSAVHDTAHCTLYTL